jgi:hypothetical protein
MGRKYRPSFTGFASLFATSLFHATARAATEAYCSSQNTASNDACTYDSHILACSANTFQSSGNTSQTVNVPNNVTASGPMRLLSFSTQTVGARITYHSNNRTSTDVLRRAVLGFLASIAAAWMTALISTSSLVGGLLELLVGRHHNQHPQPPPLRRPHHLRRKHLQSVLPFLCLEVVVLFFSPWRVLCSLLLAIAVNMGEHRLRLAFAGCG